MNLTDEQLEPVESEEPVIAVSASAGTGKTAMLLARVEHLCYFRGVDPHDILVLTFSRLARKQLEDKAEDLGLFGMNIQTFDGYALRMYAGMVGGTQPSTLVQDELDWLLRDVACSLGYANQHGGSLRWARRWTLARARKCNERWDCPVYTEDARFQNELGRRMAEANVTTFHYTMARVLSMIGDERYSIRPYRHVLVDEAQDMDERQHKLLAYHQSRGAHLFAVGDIRQCIYEWRDAAPHLWSQLCAGSRLYATTATFRCAPRVADHANRIARIGIDAALPAMVSMRAEDGCVTHWPKPSISRLISVMRKDQSIAVLCRTNATADEMSYELKAAGIEHARLRPVKHFYEPNELQGLIQLKSIRCHRYHRSFAGPGAYAIPTDVDESTGFTTVAAWYAEQGLRVFPDEWNTRFENYNVGGVIATLEAQSRNDFRESQRNQRVIIATVHGVKGLEFDHVVIADPSYDAWEGRGDPVEQARIAYVATTRARMTVNVMAPADNAPMSRYFQGGK